MIGYKMGPGPEHGLLAGNRIANGTSRQKAAQAVEYYNNNLGKSRSRVIYNRQISSPTKSLTRQLSSQDALYRSNSSLELLHDPYNVECALRREYGSHGSIDVIGNGPSPSSGENFFSMLQDYRPVVLPSSDQQQSPASGEYPPQKVQQSVVVDSLLTCDETDGGGRTSPKLRSKLAKFWARDGKVVRNGAELSSIELGTEERRRRRGFAHFDCQSLTAASVGHAARLRGLLLARRRNTATGASAASASLWSANRAATPPDGIEGDVVAEDDAGDGCTNDLIESCPFFRNEIGGEEERIVSLTRLTQRKPVHRPPLSCGVSVLEFAPGDTHWTRGHGTCPYQTATAASIEAVDHGALYYRDYFYGQEHQNWFGMDENLGPVALSIKKEKAFGDYSAAGQQSPSQQFMYRAIVRTSELQTLRGSILEESIPNLKPSGKTFHTKEVLEYVAPEISLSCLRLAVSGNQLEEQLLKLDEQGLSNQYKVGVMYCRAGQSSEEEMYNNEEAGPALLEFLDTIGQRVRLKGFEKYRAGLDNKTDSTGLYSVYSKYENCEVMFHVSTLLPFTPNNRQQLLRKRHIGNDIVTIVFQEPGALPFTPRSIRSQFQHVFIVVRVNNPCTDHTTYSVAVTRSKEVPVFGPPIPEGAVYHRGKHFADFLLAKIINAEIAAHRSSKFSTMATRTRQEYLKDLATNYVTNQVVESGQKFSIISSFSSSKKKDASRLRGGAGGICRLPLDTSIRGALCWQVVLEDSGQSQLLECFLGISTDTIVLVDEVTRDLVMVTPCHTVLGWSVQTSSIRVYHHQGECITVHMRDQPCSVDDDLLEIVLRLRAVTGGCAAQEIALRRNAAGQLGFHVQPDGIVTQVEPHGQAYGAGLRQGSRLVEICKIAVSTLSHDQMVDLLKTSVSVCVTVIAPLTDGSPRRGCSLHDCKYTLNNYEGDYENLQSSIDSPPKTSKKSAAVIQQLHSRKKYERSFSPPRSSASSGYGTGSSSKSFADHDKFSQVANPLNINEDRWYEETAVNNDPSLYHDGNTTTPPPPLPARITATASTISVPRSENVLQLARKWEAGRGSWGEGYQSVGGNRQPSNGESRHVKVHGTQSLPLQELGGLSLASVGPSNGRYPAYEDFNGQQDYKLNNEKMTAIKLSPEKHYSALRLSTKMHESNSLPNDCFRDTPQGGSTDGSTLSGHSGDSRLLKAPSEDELSSGSGHGSSSPRSRRTKFSNPDSSRNNSPRNGEVRLRPGVTNRGVTNRNSANLTNSTLQEDLMRLINLDYQDPHISSNKSETGDGPLIAGKIRTSGSSTSLIESQKTASNCDQKAKAVSTGEAISKNGGEVILTTARPATVISNPSTASSPAPSEPLKMSKEESVRRLSPRVTKYNQQYTKSSADHTNNIPSASSALPIAPLTLQGPCEVDKDWPSLVDTATRAMLPSAGNKGVSIAATSQSTQADSEQTTVHLGAWCDDLISSSKIDTPSPSSTSGVPVGQQRTKVLIGGQQQQQRGVSSSLTSDDEVRRLREENRSLRDENRRLQEESHAAAQQLRRFTEWFFQTIERQ